MFCAGADPSSFADAAKMSDATNRKSSVSFMKFLYFFQNVPQFTICLVQGSVMGSGLGILAVCDMVMCTSTARFTSSEVKIGLTPATVAPFLVTKVGPAHAKRILCLCENISATQAKQMGLVQLVVDTEADFSSNVASVCEKLTLCAPIATGRSKRLVQNVNNQPLTPAVLEYTGGELASIRIGDEAVKGMIAVQARTKPYWTENPIKPLY